jgi:hypothetical protein
VNTSIGKAIAAETTAAEIEITIEELSIASSRTGVLSSAHCRQIRNGHLGACLLHRYADEISYSAGLLVAPRAAAALP